MDSAISIKNLKKRYHDPALLEVISGITFDIKRHEFVSICGPVGCGKTTLLLMICNLIKPDFGEVFLNGEPICENAPSIGLVFQEYNRSLFEWRTVRGNIEFGLEMRGIKGSKKKEITDRVLESFDLKGCQDYYPGQISGGMKQKTAIARALAYDPEVLLMDEPFGSLDVQTKRWLVEAVEEVHKVTRKTTLMVTHDVEEALYLSDRIIVLSDKPARVKKIISFDPALRKNKDAEFRSMKGNIEDLIEQRFEPLAPHGI